MTDAELLDKVRELRLKGWAPKGIAKSLGVPQSVVAPLIRAIGEERAREHAEPPLLGCWVNVGWSGGLSWDGHPEWREPDGAAGSEMGLVQVLAARKDRNDRVEAAGFLVDTYCLGIKDGTGRRRLQAHELDDLVHGYFRQFPRGMTKVDLDLVQHIVFGAAEYAARLGFQPAPEFETTKHLFGPWTGPSAIRFGRHGKPFFIQGPRDDPEKVIATLERTVGHDGYDFLVVDGDSFDEMD